VSPRRSRPLLVLALVALLVGLIGSPPASAVTLPPGGALAGGTAGAYYEFSLAGSDQTGSVTYSMAGGALPPGLTLNKTTGLVSGHATATGTFNFMLSAADDGGTVTSAWYSLTIICPSLTFSSSVANGTVGTAYSGEFLLEGANPPGINLIWLTRAPGLTLSGNAVEGTPTGGGDFNVLAEYTSPYGCYYYRDDWFHISAPAITLTPTTVASGTVGVAYSQEIAASGSIQPYTLAVSDGTLPPGLSLVDGTLTGTPTATGDYTFTLRATDSATGTGPYSGWQEYQISIAPPPITLTPTTVASGTVGVAYSQEIAASGGTPGYSLAVSDGTLPPGLSLVDGTLTGTPTAGGDFTFTLQATDSSTGTGPYHGSQEYQVSIAAPTITLTPTTAASGTVGVAYSQEIAASGGTPGYSLAVSNGTLPPGLSLVNGTLTGTPTAGGDFTFTLRATDSSTGTGPYHGSQEYQVSIAAPTIMVSPDAIEGAARAGEPYTATLSATGGTGTHTFTVTAGTLPPGLTLSPSGALSGTPTAPGSYAFTVSAADSSPAPAGPYVGTRAYAIEVAPAWAAPAITLNPTDTSVRSGTDVDLHAAASGNPEPTVQWQVETATGWVDLSGATETTLRLPKVTTTHRYRAVFSNDHGTPATTTAAKVSILPVVVTPATSRPVITQQPKGTTVKAGRTARLTARAIGKPAPTVQWQVKVKGRWTTIKGATSTTLVLPKVKQSWNRRAYRAVFTNKVGKVTTRAVLLKVRKHR
jgi:large repetitive protein